MKQQVKGKAARAEALVTTEFHIGNDATLHFNPFKKCSEVWTSLSSLYPNLLSKSLEIDSLSTCDQSQSQHSVCSSPACNWALASLCLLSCQIGIAGVSTFNAAANFKIDIHGEHQQVTVSRRHSFHTISISRRNVAILQVIPPNATLVFDVELINFR